MFTLLPDDVGEEELATGEDVGKSKPDDTCFMHL